MTALTKEEFEAGIAQLKESISAAVGENFVLSLTTALKEALKPAEVTVEGTAEVAEIVESAEVVEAVEVDHAALVTAITEAGLPAAVINTVVADVMGGTEIADAIAKQTTLREAFAETSAASNVRIVEAERDAGKSLNEQILATLGKGA